LTDKTVSSMDAATEPPGMGLRRVWEGGSCYPPPGSWFLAPGRMFLAFITV